MQSASFVRFEFSSLRALAGFGMLELFSADGARQQWSSGDSIVTHLATGQNYRLSFGGAEVNISVDRQGRLAPNNLLTQSASDSGRYFFNGTNAGNPANRVVWRDYFLDIQEAARRLGPGNLTTFWNEQSHTEWALAADFSDSVPLSSDSSIRSLQRSIKSLIQKWRSAVGRS